MVDYDALQRIVRLTHADPLTQAIAMFILGGKTGDRRDAVLDAAMTGLTSDDVRTMFGDRVRMELLLNKDLDRLEDDDPCQWARLIKADGRGNPHDSAFYQLSPFRGKRIAFFTYGDQVDVLLRGSVYNGDLPGTDFLLVIDANAPFKDAEVHSLSQLSAVE